MDILYRRRSLVSPSRDPSKDEENLHVCRVINTFRSYKEKSKNRLDSKLNYLSSLPKEHQERLGKYKESLIFQLKCIEINDQIMSKIADDVNIFENENYDLAGSILRANEIKPSLADHEKTHNILKQIGKILNFFFFPYLIYIFCSPGME